MFSGRDLAVPYSEGVVKSAPCMLTVGQIEESLNSSPKHEEEFRKVVATRGGDAEAAAVAATLSIGGVWTLAQIDNRVLDALTFSSSGNPDSFSSLQEIADRYHDSQGAVTRLSGYVAEQQVAVDLTREGHVVEFPDGPTQPRWDLLIDGHPVQVKCTMEPDAVTEHLARYPDTPVIVNSELADQLGDHPGVWVDQSLSHSEVMSTTDESLDALGDFADADDLLPIPALALAFAVVRNGGSFLEGRITGSTFAQHVAVDVASRTVAGTVGTSIGALVGSLATPIGTVAGAGLGGFVGSVIGRTIADGANHPLRCEARDDVIKNLGDFALWFRKDLLGPRIQLLKKRQQNLTEWAQETSATRQMQSCVATFYAASAEMLARAEDLNAWIEKRERGDDFARAHAGWVALRESGAFFHPELKTRLARVRESIQRYQDLVQPAEDVAPSPAKA